MAVIIKTKKKHSNVLSLLDVQYKDYVKMIKAEHDKYIINQYYNYKVRKSYYCKKYVKFDDQNA